MKPRLHNLEKRRLEWWLSTSTTFYAAVVCVPFWNSFRVVDDKSILTVLGSFSETTWGIVLLVGGLLHMIALQVNGRAAWTPFARLVAVTLNCATWGWLGWTFRLENPVSAAFLMYGLVLPYAALFITPSIAKDMAREAAIYFHERSR